jgi:hypothetical protein
MTSKEKDQDTTQQSATLSESGGPFSDGLNQELTPAQRKEALLDLQIEVKARQPKPIPDEDLEPIRHWKRVKARRAQR